MGLMPGLGRSPGGGNGPPLQYSCLENLQISPELGGHGGRSCPRQAAAAPAARATARLETDGVRRLVQSPSVRMTGPGQSAGTCPSASLLKVAFSAAGGFERAGEEHSEATATSCRRKRKTGPPALHPCPQGEAPLESP